MTRKSLSSFPMARFSAYRLVIWLVLLCTGLFFAAKDVQTPTTRYDEKSYLYIGLDPSNPNVNENCLQEMIMASRVVKQYHVDLLFMWKLYEQLDDSSKDKIEIFEEIKETMNHRLHLDSSIDFIGKLIFGSANGTSILKSVRPSDQPLVDDWDCLKSMIHIYESHCGLLTSYGLKHMGAFANICNRDVAEEAMERASVSVCEGYNLTKWSPLIHCYSA